MTSEQEDFEKNIDRFNIKHKVHLFYEIKHCSSACINNYKNTELTSKEKNCLGNNYLKFKKIVSII